MYTIDTDIINGYDNGQQITEEAYKMLLAKGCPEDWFLKIETEFDIGQWYTPLNRYEGYAIFKASKKGLSENHLCGISYKGRWTEPFNNIGSTCGHRKATPEEIKDHLTEEAKKRDLIDNKYKSLQSGGIEVEGSIDEINYIQSVDKLWIGYNNGYLGVAYYKGEWAEPIDTTPNIEINGYKAEFHDDYVQFGCRKISKSTIIEINEIINTGDVDLVSMIGTSWKERRNGLRVYENAKSIRDQIKQIAKYYQ